MKNLIVHTITIGCLVTISTAFAQDLRQAVSSAQAPQPTAAAIAPALPVAAASTSVVRQPGVVRIGIIEPKSNLGAQGSVTAGEPVRAAEAQLLASPKVEVVKLNALLPAQAAEEAKLQGCDYILSSSISQKAKSGFGGMGGLKAWNAVANQAGMLPRSGIGTSVVAMEATQTAVTAMSVMSSSVKAKSEVTFEYSLDSLAGQNILKDAQKSKASEDGEDVITPMVEQAATRILTAVSKPN